MKEDEAKAFFSLSQPFNDLFFSLIFINLSISLLLSLILSWRLTLQTSPEGNELYDDRKGGVVMIGLRGQGGGGGVEDIGIDRK